MTAVTTDITERLDAMIQADLADGHTNGDAYDRAYEWIIENGYAADVLRAVGPRIINLLWVEWRHRERLTAERSPDDAQPVGRLVDADTLNSSGAMLDQLFPVGNTWIRLGDLVRGQCQAIAVSYTKRAASMEKKARFFESLSERLTSPTERIRDRLTDADVRAMLKEQSL